MTINCRLQICEVFRGKFSVSAFALSVILTTISIAVGSICVGLITIHFSEKAALDTAQKLTHVMKDKTSLVVQSNLRGATSVAEGAQSGILLASNVHLPSESNESHWYDNWEIWGMMYKRALGQAVNDVSFNFEDGSYLAVGNHVPESEAGLVLAWGRVGYNLTFPAKNDAVTPYFVFQNEYNASDLRLLRIGGYTSQVDPRQRSYYNRNMKPFERFFGSVVFTSFGTPNIMVAYALYNSSNTFLGIGELRLNLQVFAQSLIVSQNRIDTNVNSFILDRSRNVISSTIADLPILTTTEVTLDYVLSAEDTYNGCAITTFNTSVGLKNLVCLRNAETYGFAPLRHLGELGHIPSSSESLAAQGEISLRSLADSGEYYVSLQNYNEEFPNLDWISIVLISEDEVRKEIVHGRQIAIAVTVAFGIFLAILNGLLLRLFLRPLADVVLRMQSAEYLSEEASSQDIDSSVSSSENTLRRQSTEEGTLASGLAAAAAKKSRSLSYLTDVAAIQKAYWDMADELRLLRGYIPESIRSHRLTNVLGGTSTDRDKLASAQELHDLELVNSFAQLPGNGDGEPALPATHSPQNEDGRVDGNQSTNDIATINNVKSHLPYYPLSIENNLVERPMTVVAVNIVGFHRYVKEASSTSGIVKEHESFVSLLHEMSKQFGGTLDHFNGDKFWLSFNAQAPCDEHQISATTFACELEATIRKEVSFHEQYASEELTRPAGKPPRYFKAPRTQIAWRGITVGVATSMGLVGVLGTNKIKRHTITGNAVSEASALERMAVRYPDCSIMVGEDLLPFIDGYFQYLILDATSIPGSRGRRRCIASIKWPLFSVNNKNHAVSMLKTIRQSLPSVANAFAELNNCFVGFLKGNITEVNSALAEITTFVALSRQFGSAMRRLPDGRTVLSHSECENITMMVNFVMSLIDAGVSETYCGPLGSIFERT